MRGKSIIVVEDDEDDVLVLKTHLQTLGLDCDVFSSTEKAFKSLETKNYNYAFVDVLLPGISGMEFIKYITEEEDKMKVVFISGSEALFNRFPTGVFFSFILKPVSLLSIKKVLK